MTNIKKIFNLILSFSLLFSTCVLSAQVNPYAQNPFAVQNSFSLQKRIQFVDGRLQEIQIPKATRPEGMDLYTLLESFDKSGFLTSCEYFSIVVKFFTKDTYRFAYELGISLGGNLLLR